VSLIAAAATLLVLVGGGWWLLSGRYTEVPQLANLARPQAGAALRDAGLKVKYGDAQHHDTFGKDVVLSQEPRAGAEVVKGEQITVVLSLGAERHEVPDIAGMDLESARNQLAAVKLQVKEGEAKFSDDLPKGLVLSFEPKAGTELKRDDTVTVVLSKGRAPITVPNVVGRNINDARGQLQGLKLTVLEQLKDSDRPAGEVLAQSLKEGAGVDKGAEIKLDVSKGPPFVVVPRVVGMPCQQAKQTLEGLGLRVRVDLNPNGTVLAQQPGENTQVPPQLEMAIQCL
jgi:serine/threonine-protein kinase